MTKISVIIPTYNRSKTLGRAIDSVLKQTYTDWELIIVDDASTDNTEEFVKKYTNENIRYYKNYQNRQKSYTRNFGVSKARGEYVAFLDSDDEWLPQKLEKQLISLNKDEFIGCFTGAYKIQGERKTSRRPSIKESLLLDILKNRISISMGSTCLVRKDIFEKSGGFREDMTVNEDIELAVRLCFSNNLIVISEPLINIYDIDKPRDARRILEAKEKLLSYTENIIKQLDQKDQKITYARQYLSVARAYATEGNLKDTIKFLKKSLSYEFLFSERISILPTETYIILPILLIRHIIYKD